MRIPNVRRRLVPDDLVYLAGVSPLGARRFAATRGWTILVASNGNARRVGDAVFIEEDRGFLFGSFLIAVAPKPRSGLEPKFLYYFLKTPQVRRSIAESVRGTTGLKNLSQEVLFSLLLPRYAFAEQRHVVSTLDAIDDLIRNAETLADKLEAIKSGLAGDLFTRGLRPDGRLRDPATNLDECKHSALGRIPSSWKVATLGDCFDRFCRYPTYYGIEYLDHGVPEVRGELIRADGSLEEDDELYRHVSPTTASRFPNARLQPDDFVISVRGTVGKIATVPQRLRRAVITANLMLMRPAHSVGHENAPPMGRSAIVPRWASHFLRSAIFRRALDLATSATTVKTIQASQLRGIQLGLPPVDEQLRVAEILDAHHARISTEEAYLEKLRLKQTGLIDDLFSGRVF